MSDDEDFLHPFLKFTSPKKNNSSSVSPKKNSLRVTPEYFTSPKKNNKSKKRKSREKHGNEDQLGTSVESLNSNRLPHNADNRATPTQSELPSSSSMVQKWKKIAPIAKKDLSKMSKSPVQWTSPGTPPGSPPATPIKGTPIKGTPIKGTPTKGTPIKGSLRNGTPIKGTPIKIPKMTRLPAREPAVQRTPDSSSAGFNDHFVDTHSLSFASCGDPSCSYMYSGSNENKMEAPEKVCLVALADSTNSASPPYMKSPRVNTPSKSKYKKEKPTKVVLPSVESLKKYLNSDKSSSEMFKVLQNADGSSMDTTEMGVYIQNTEGENKTSEILDCSTSDMIDIQVENVDTLQADSVTVNSVENNTKGVKRKKKIIDSDSKRKRVEMKDSASGVWISEEDVRSPMPSKDKSSLGFASNADSMQSLFDNSLKRAIASGMNSSAKKRTMKNVSVPSRLRQRSRHYRKSKKFSHSELYKEFKQHVAVESKKAKSSQNITLDTIASSGKLNSRKSGSTERTPPESYKLRKKKKKSTPPEVKSTPPESKSTPPGSTPKKMKRQDNSSSLTSTPIKAKTSKSTPPTSTPRKKKDAPSTTSTPRKRASKSSSSKENRSATPNRKQLTSTPEKENCILSPIKVKFRTPRKSGRKADKERELEEGKEAVKRNLYGEPNRESVSSDDSDAMYITTDEESDEAERTIRKQCISWAKCMDKVAGKRGLTATNVRTMFNEVKNNEEVQKLMSKLISDEQDDKLQVKMTRSKVKEELQKGPDAVPWSLSPQKKMQEPKFLDVEFSDDDDEDEYKPPTDIEDASEEESFTSADSDIGSPCVKISTPLMQTIEEGCALSLESPPMLLSASHRGGVFAQPQGFLSPVPSHFHNHGLQRTPPVAPPSLRTRSKYQVPESTLELVNKFHLPDDIPEIGQSQPYVDPDYAEFLFSIQNNYDLPELDTTQEDEVTDPMYDFMNDFMREQDDPDDLRRDKGVRISKKEGEELRNTLYDWYIEGDEAEPYSLEPEELTQPAKPAKCEQPKSGYIRGQTKYWGPDKENIKKERAPKRRPANVVVKKDEGIFRPSYPRMDIFRKPENKILLDNAVGSQPVHMLPQPVDMPEEIPPMTESEARQLQDQLRKYVQLASQNFIMSLGTDQEKNITLETKRQLIDLSFRGQMSELEDASAFHTPNLSAAVDLVLNPPQARDFKTGQKRLTKLIYEQHAGNYGNSKDHHHISLMYHQMDAFANSSIFLFPQMLPMFTYTKCEKKPSRVRFLPSEDNLLAMGLSVYGTVADKFFYIQKEFLPSRSKDQIRFRSKNLYKREWDRKKQLNPVWYLQKNNRLPDYPRYEELEAVENIVPPIRRDKKFLPLWMPLYIQASNNISPIKTRGKRVKKEDVMCFGRPLSDEEWTTTNSSRPSSVKSVNLDEQDNTEEEEISVLQDGSSCLQDGSSCVQEESTYLQDRLSYVQEESSCVQDGSSALPDGSIVVPVFLNADGSYVLGDTQTPTKDSRMMPPGLVHDDPAPPPLSSTPPLSSPHPPLAPAPHLSLAPKGPIPHSPGRCVVAVPKPPRKKQRRKGEARQPAERELRSQKHLASATTKPLPQRRRQQQQVMILNEDNELVENVNSNILVMTQEQMEELERSGAVCIANGDNSYNVPSSTSPPPLLSMPTFTSPMKDVNTPTKHVMTFTPRKNGPSYEATVETMSLAVEQTDNVGSPPLNELGYTTPSKCNPNNDSFRTSNIKGIGNVLNINTPEKSGTVVVTPGAGDNILQCAIANTLGMSVDELQGSPDIERLLCSESPLKRKHTTPSPRKRGINDRVKKSICFDTIAEEGQDLGAEKGKSKQDAQEQETQKKPILNEEKKREEMIPIIPQVRRITPKTIDQEVKKENDHFEPSIKSGLKKLKIVKDGKASMPNSSQKNSQSLFSEDEDEPLAVPFSPSCPVFNNGSLNCTNTEDRMDTDDDPKDGKQIENLISNGQKKTDHSKEELERGAFYKDSGYVGQDEEVKEQDEEAREQDNEAGEQNETGEQDEQAGEQDEQAGEQENEEQEQEHGGNGDGNDGNDGNDGDSDDDEDHDDGIEPHEEEDAEEEEAEEDLEETQKTKNNPIEEKLELDHAHEKLDDKKHKPTAVFDTETSRVDIISSQDGCSMSMFSFLTKDNTSNTQLPSTSKSQMASTSRPSLPTVTTFANVGDEFVKPHPLREQVDGSSDEQDTAHGTNVQDTDAINRIAQRLNQPGNTSETATDHAPGTLGVSVVGSLDVDVDIILPETSNTLLHVPSLDSLLPDDPHHLTGLTQSAPQQHMGCQSASNLLVTPTKLVMRGEKTTPFKRSTPKLNFPDSPMDSNAIRHLVEAAEDMKLPTPKKTFSPSVKAFKPHPVVSEVSQSSEPMPSIFSPEMHHLCRTLSNSPSKYESRSKYVQSPLCEPLFKIPSAEDLNDDVGGCGDGGVDKDKEHTSLRKRTPKKKSSAPLTFASFRSPSKQFKFILPKSPSPQKRPAVSPSLPKQKKSPRRAQLKQQVRAILPKGLVLEKTFPSPSKMAAASITAKAKRLAQSPKAPLGRLRMTEARKQRRKVVSRNLLKDMEEKTPKDDKIAEALRLARMTRKERAEEMKKKAKMAEEMKKKAKMAAENEENSEEEDENTHLARLMAASSTISGETEDADAARKRLLEYRKASKQQKQDARTLELLQPDIVENDPKRDEKEIAFAHAYLARVEKATKDADGKNYMKFLTLINEFARHIDVKKLCEGVSELLKGHTELLEDFAAFLNPGEAHEVGLLMANIQHRKVTEFLRKIEIAFKDRVHKRDEILKALCRENATQSELRDVILPMLRGHPHLIEEFRFMLNEEIHPRDDDSDDFETVTLPGSSTDEDQPSPPSFEEVTLETEIGDEAHFGTSLCKCDCHVRQTDDKLFLTKKRHCLNCGLKIIRGNMYLQTEKKLQRLHIIHSRKANAATTTPSEPSGKAAKSLTPNSVHSLSDNIIDGSETNSNDTNETNQEAADMDENVGQNERTVKAVETARGVVASGADDNVKAKEGGAGGNDGAGRQGKSSGKLKIRINKSKLTIKSKISPKPKADSNSSKEAKRKRKEEKKKRKEEAGEKKKKRKQEKEEGEEKRTKKRKREEEGEEEKAERKKRKLDKKMRKEKEQEEKKTKKKNSRRKEKEAGEGTSQEASSSDIWTKEEDEVILSYIQQRSSDCDEDDMVAALVSQLQKSALSIRTRLQRIVAFLQPPDGSSEGDDD